MMKQVNYRIWAHIIRCFLFAGICFQLLGFGVSLAKDIFKLKTDFSLGTVDYGYRDYSRGYPVKTSMELTIPKTVVNYRNGTMHHDVKRKSGREYNWHENNTENIKDTLLNQIKPEFKYTLDENELQELGAVADSASNRILISEPVTIHVKPKDASHRWFYIVYGHLDNFFMVIIFIWLIKLINSYLKERFLTQRSFVLIKKIGYSFIRMNVISFIFMLNYSRLLPDFNLVSSAKTTGLLINTIGLHLRPSLRFDINYILIGVSILIISDIIKNAIFIKREQDLTI